MADPKDLSMAYGMKRKNRKKMAKGGEVTAKTQSRPMPDQRHNDAMEIMHNSGNKAPSQDSWTSRPDINQSQKGPQTTAIKHPKMVPTNAFSVRLRDEEANLQSSASINNGPQTQPPKADNEIDADKSGPSTPSLKMKMMAEGGMINNEVSMASAEDDMAEHPAGLESDNDQMRPDQDEYMSSRFAEGGMANAIRMRRKYAEGGQVDLAMNAEEGPADLEDLNSEAAMKENYSESEGLSQMTSPMDSNEHGHDIDSDEHDRISAMRSRMNKRRQFGN